MIQMSLYFVLASSVVKSPTCEFLYVMTAVRDFLRLRFMNSMLNLHIFIEFLVTIAKIQDSPLYNCCSYHIIAF